SAQALCTYSQEQHDRHLPTKKARRLPVRFVAFLLVLVLLGSASTAGLAYVQSAILGPLATFIHPIDRGSLDLGGSSLTGGRAWNMLLLGSDTDTKFVFPDVLTQVMMVAHID